jgi:excisionase family DNA binding protein
MALMSLAQAAAATGLHKTTLLRAVRAGRITGTKDASGQWRVDPAELHRVFPAAPAAMRPDAFYQHSAPPRAAPQTRGRAFLAELEAALRDMTAQRDSWQQLAERLSRALNRGKGRKAKKRFRPRRQLMRNNG